MALASGIETEVLAAAAASFTLRAPVAACDAAVDVIDRDDNEEEEEEEEEDDVVVARVLPRKRVLAANELLPNLLEDPKEDESPVDADELLLDALEVGALAPSTPVSWGEGERAASWACSACTVCCSLDFSSRINILSFIACSYFFCSASRAGWYSLACLLSRLRSVTRSFFSCTSLLWCILCTSRSRRNLAHVPFASAAVVTAAAAVCFKTATSF